jgi:tetratricopeptide (TPR) repeat protein
METLEELLQGRNILDLDTNTDKRLLHRVRDAAQKEKAALAAAQANEALEQHYEAGVWYRRAGKNDKALEVFVIGGAYQYETYVGDPECTKKAIGMLVEDGDEERAKALYFEQTKGDLDLLIYLVQKGIELSRAEYDDVMDAYKDEDREEHWSSGLLAVGSLTKKSSQTALKILKSLEVDLTSVCMLTRSEHISHYDPQQVIDVFGEEETVGAFTMAARSSLPATNVLVSFFVENGEIEKARDFYEGVQDSQSKKYRESDAKTALLHAYLEKGDLAAAKELYMCAPAGMQVLNALVRKGVTFRTGEYERIGRAYIAKSLVRDVLCDVLEEDIPQKTALQILNANGISVDDIYTNNHYNFKDLDTQTVVEVYGLDLTCKAQTTRIIRVFQNTFIRQDEVKKRAIFVRGVLGIESVATVLDGWKKRLVKRDEVVKAISDKMQQYFYNAYTSTESSLAPASPLPQ